MCEGREGMGVSAAGGQRLETSATRGHFDATHHTLVDFDDGFPRTWKVLDGCAFFWRLR